MRGKDKSVVRQLDTVTTRLMGKDARKLWRRAAAACFANSVLGAVVLVTLFVGPDLVPWALSLTLVGLQIYILLALAALLTHRHDYHRGNVWLLAMMGAVVIVATILVAENPITAPGAEWYLLAAFSLLVYGVLQILLLIKTIRWGRSVHGLLGIHCVMSIAGCALCGTVVLSWLGVPILIAAEVVLGVLFLRAARALDTVEEHACSDTAQADEESTVKTPLTNGLFAVQLVLLGPIVVVPLTVFVLGDSEAGSMASSAMSVCLGVAAAAVVQLGAMIAMLFMRPSVFQRIVSIASGAISVLVVGILVIFVLILVLAGPLL